MHGYEYVIFTKNDIVIPPFDDDYFQTIKYKNFLSCGNYFIEIQRQRSTTLVVGNNGSGKSTMLDALTFALFGKSFRESINLSYQTLQMKENV